MRRTLSAGALCLLVGCRSQDRTPAADSPHEEGRLPARPGSPPSDHVVYAAVLRAHFPQPRGGGEHSLHCEREAPEGRFEIVGTTQPLPPGTVRRDSGWAAVLPGPAAPLMAVLRALDRQPGRRLNADSLLVGAPIHLLSDSLAARTLRSSDQSDKRRDSSAPPLYWVSRVAYSADGEWALVYAAEVCPGVTEAMAEEAENGAYQTTLLAPLRRRAGVWTVQTPLFLDIGLPRLEPRQQRE